MEGTSISAQITNPLLAVDPSVKLSMNRQLFRRRLETASLELEMGKHPRFAFNLILPKVFGIDAAQALSEESKDPSGPPSASGLKFGTTYTMIGFAFEDIVPKLVAEWGLHFSELALRLKLALQLGITGLGWVCTGTWSPTSVTNFAVATHLNPTGVVLRLESIRMARRDLEDDLGRRREQEAVISLLKDTARKSQQAETSKGGE
ncbi:hypothetical protein H0H81_000097 [Sphagnurus paluster]|uniref:DNAJC11-like beta-barrel domain-containing protein n=1 Tax=Sphagnurus paluster TaxID=117069 RepID=A0A9P7GPR2_9AGAR|nr:hypothetical protein H0H81_000097 [Sphagnurus paluster]